MKPQAELRRGLHAKLAENVTVFLSAIIRSESTDQTSENYNLSHYYYDLVAL